MRSSLFLLAFVLLFILSACEKKEEKVPVVNAPAGTHVVKVEDRIDASDYSYFQVSEKDGIKYWIAAKRLEAVKGDILYFTKSMEMKNFHSNTLNRTFESVLFVDDITKTPHVMNNPGSTPPIDPKTAHSQVMSTPKIDVKIDKVKDGKTVEQIYSSMEKLNGQIIKVRGKVVKYNPEIMGRNWIHIQDGTGSESGYDLMVTSKDQTAIGQIIVVEGKVATNKDFGAGYTYKVMIEDAAVKTEKGI
ncbi:MAG: hypothetical protein P4L35_08555 [Ignavibacteriaceae bacterium]|nr:hypothetical protein [Ignavibacteriaceae bacterium]